MNKEMIIKLRKMGTHVNILYVEDDYEVSEQFEALFRKVFKNIDVVRDGQQGLELYKKNIYNIVITDIEMPNMDGIELIKRIREINPHQLVVVTSAYNDSKYLQELIECGVEKFLLKPFNMSKLFYDISKIVSNIYNEKCEKKLQLQVEEKMKLNQLLLDKMITPIAVINTHKIIYTNEKFNELFKLPCDTQDSSCYISSIFKSDKISQLDHTSFLECIELDFSEKFIYLRSGSLERFSIILSPLVGTSKTLVNFVNSEVVSKEVDRLKVQKRLDPLTNFYTREIFVEQLDTVLDASDRYCALCFGLSHLKEFIRLFGVGSLRDIYKKLAEKLQLYFEKEIMEKRVTFYYFDTNHFVLLLPCSQSEETKSLLKSFGDKETYTSKNAKTYESMHLDVLTLKLDNTLSVEKNIIEVENRLYMLKGEVS